MVDPKVTIFSTVVQNYTNNKTFSAKQCFSFSSARGYMFVIACFICGKIFVVRDATTKTTIVFPPNYLLYDKYVTGSHACS